MSYPHGRRLLALGALLFSPYLIMALWLADHRGLRVCADYVFVCTAGVFLLALAARTARRFVILHFPVFVLCVLICGCTLVGGQLPGYPLAFILMTSSWEEVRGYFGLWEGQRLVVVFLGSSLCYLMLSWSVPARTSLVDSSPRVRRIIISCFGLMAVGAALTAEQLVESVSASPVLGTAMFLHGPVASADYTIHGAMKRKRPYGAQRAGHEEVHILVIGESSRRDSWSVYGYSRPTTPYLESIKSQVVFFTDAISDANATVYAVPMVLSGIGPEAFTFSAFHGNLLDLGKEAGYFSVWLANQDPGPSSLVGVAADASTYTYQPKKATYFIYPPDEVLLPALDRQITHKGTSLFIGMHVYGSHAPYLNRYPRAFAHFETTQQGAAAHLDDGGAQNALIDSYDDSILYTDWFLGQVIQRARKLDVPVTVTYLSDHGEDLQQLDGRSGHGATDYSPHAFEIPAFIWMNSAYRSAHPDKVAALIANASREVRSHDFFYSLADLMGIRWPDYSPQRSFASTDFVPDTADRHIAGGGLVSRPTPDSRLMVPRAMPDLQDSGGKN